MKHYFLLIEREEKYAPALAQKLHTGGFKSARISHLTQITPMVRSHRPSVIVVLGNIAVQVLNEWMATLSLQPETNSLPWIIASQPFDLTTALSSFHSGAAAILHCLDDLQKLAFEIIENVGSEQNHSRSMRAIDHSGPTQLKRIADYISKNKLSCLLKIDRNTDLAAFKFVDGELLDAVCGQRHGQNAVNFLYECDDQNYWRFSQHFISSKVPGKLTLRVLEENDLESKVQENTVSTSLIDAFDDDFSMDDIPPDISLASIEFYSVESETNIALQPIEQGFLDLEESQEQLQPAPKANATELAELPKLKVLIVDDEPSLLELYSRILNQISCDIQTAFDGNDAFEKAIVWRPDLILSDIMMPNTDGWGLLGLIRGDFRVRDTIFILLSCHTEFLTHLEDFKAGADDYIQKSFRPSELKVIINNNIKKRRHLIAVIKKGLYFRDVLHTLGASGYLETLSQKNITALFIVKAQERSFYLKFADGIIAGAVLISLGKEIASGHKVFHLLLKVENGTVEVRPISYNPKRINVPLNINATFMQLKEQLFEALNKEQSRNAEKMISMDKSLVAIGEELANFYKIVCADALRPALSSLLNGETPRTVMANSEMSPLIIEALVLDLLRKGVAQFVE